jgi:hypothetical protein
MCLTRKGFPHMHMLHAPPWQQTSAAMPHHHHHTRTCPPAFRRGLHSQAVVPKDNLQVACFYWRCCVVGGRE